MALDLILIPPGEFNYGSDTTEVGRDTMFEIKRRRETVKSAFFMGRYEVTQEQWRAAFGEDAPASGEGKRTPRQPVSFVTFVHASDFLTLLNRKTGVQFRLPTEVEWEYACRAGTDGPYYCDLASMLPKYEWFNTKGMQPLTTKVVEPKEVWQLRPNPWGLYDMLGNVNEWCGGVPEGHFRGHGGRPVRGGSIIEKDIRCKATSRHPTSPDSTGWTGASNAILGFRVALDVEEYRKLVRDSAPRTVPKE